MDKLFINESFEKSFAEIIDSNYNLNSKYDYMVLFSGGKDSSYLAHIFKSFKGGRVLLFTVDNGFEENETLINVRAMAEKLKCDLYISKTRQSKFSKLFNFVLTEPSLLEIDTNPLCYFCSKAIANTGIEFADNNNIPIVVNGAASDQLTLGQDPQTPFEVKMFESVMAQSMKKIQEKLQSTDRYKEDAELQEILNLIFFKPKNTKLLYPFHYINYDIKKIKADLVSNYGWEDPTKKEGNDIYWSSGCKLVNLMGVFEKYVNGFEAHEKKQIENEFNKGILEETAYNAWLKKFEKEREAEISNEVISVLKKLNLENMVK